MAMHVASDELALRFSMIRENLDKLRESIANGFLKDAMRFATQLNNSTGQLSTELVTIPSRR
jgi:hypothetical protein